MLRDFFYRRLFFSTPILIQQWFRDMYIIQFYIYYLFFNLSEQGKEKGVDCRGGWLKRINKYPCHSHGVQNVSCRLSPLPLWMCHCHCIMQTLPDKKASWVMTSQCRDFYRPPLSSSHPPFTKIRTNVCIHIYISVCFLIYTLQVHPLPPLRFAIPLYQKQ